MQLQSNERALFVGKTKSGKTYLARLLTQPLARLIVFDSKGEIGRGKSGNWNFTSDWKNGIKLLQKPNERCRIRIPSIDLVDDRSYEDYFLQIFKKCRNVVVYCDELYQVGPARGSHGLKLLYTAGREYDIGVWSSVQRPKSIPPFAISEAEWIFMFQLRLKRDKQALAETGLGDMAYYPLKDHNLIVYNDAMKDPIFYTRVDAS